MSTFDIVLFRKTLKGLERVTLTVDANACIVGEASASVDTYSVFDTYNLYMRGVVDAGNTMRAGVTAEREALMKKLSEERVDANGNKTIQPTPAAVKVARIMTQTESPCVTERCKEIRAAYEKEIAEAGGAACSDCSRGGIIAKYQQLLLSEKVYE